MSYKDECTDLAWNLPREVAVGGVLEVALVAVAVVADVHLPVVIHPQLAHDDVVDGGGHLSPGVVVTWLLKHQVSDTYTKQQTNPCLYLYHK